MRFSRLNSKKRKWRQLDEAGRRAHELANKALTLQTNTTKKAIGSVKDVADDGA